MQSSTSHFTNNSSAHIHGRRNEGALGAENADVDYSVPFFFTTDKRDTDNLVIKMSGILYKTGKKESVYLSAAWYVTRAGNGSMGHGSWVKWVTKIGWVTWVMGH